MSDDPEVVVQEMEGAAPIDLDHPPTIMSLFDELSLKQHIKRVMHGLRQPKDTGEYKFAMLQIYRLSAPAMAVIVPFFAVLMLAIFGAMGQDATPSKLEVMIVEPETVEMLDEIEDLKDEPIEPPEPIEMEFTPTDAPSVSDVSTPAPAVNQPFAPKPASFDSVAVVKSPIVLKGIIGNRSPGSRGSALSEYGGSGVTEAAVLRALRWLKKEQRPDGSWVSPPVAMTGFGLLCFLAHGETPASEEFGATVEKAIKYLLGKQQANGRFPGNYDIPIATYAICEAYGLTQVPMLQESAEKAIAAVIAGQHESGGWDYNLGPGTRDDTSYMGWCAQALKAGHMAGIQHSDLMPAMKKAVKGFQKNAHPAGGFGYTGPGQGGLTGVGALCMQLLGAAKEKEVRNALVYLDQVTFDWKAPWGARPIYYWYYITQVKFHEGGETWKKWNNVFAMQLVNNQTVLKGAGADGKDIGYWDAPAEAEKSHGLVYNTALCTLMLEVYYRYLPTFKAPKDIDYGDVEVVSSDDVPVDIDI
ncbi:MAG: hypothetical protein A2498_00375 [Lentisphaerae bacterium RIFOXYC12_FULL_60_16]|nr:MAG: hypothetical protein A2498_00375 [Lentisphaerae bacterium RIFOXYC12_FULL_60_16]